MPDPDSGTRTVRLKDGRSLGVGEYGTPGGTPLFYFHGTPGSRLDLALLADEFAASGLRLIASDQPGFGLSSPQRNRTLLAWPDDVVQLADALEIDRFAVLGYSCGGKYAAACARRLPERVVAAGIVGGIGPPQTPRFREGLNSTDRMGMRLATRARPLALLYWRIAARMVNRNPDKFLAQFEKELSDADRSVLREPAFRRALIETSREALRSGPAGVVEDFAVQAKPWGFGLDEIQVPVRIWHGDQDHVVPLHHSEHVAHQIPRAELIVLEGKGHLLPMHFVEIARALTGDLAGRSPRMS